MDKEKVYDYCNQIDGLVQKIRDEVDASVDPEPEEEDIVDFANELQPAITAGGHVAIAVGLKCHNGGGYIFNTPSTKLRGLGDNKVSSDTNPALRVDTTVDDIIIESMELAASAYDSVIRIGKNDSSQTAVEQAPDLVRIHAVVIKQHRGKRGIEINGSNVEIIDCDIRDVYAPSKQDSQAIWIGNAPGPVVIEGGYFEAASECLLVGGDAMKIPNCRPTGIIIRDSTFTKKLEWKGDAAIPVKNILELKDGHDVLIENCDLSYCWPSGQDGYAFMLTPTRGGSLKNVVIKDCRVTEVSAIVNITGRDSEDTEKLYRSQIEFIGGNYRTNKIVMGGSGRFCLIGRGPEWVKFNQVYTRHEGSSFIDYSDKEVIEQLHVIGCDWNYGTYGIRIGGYNHGDNQLGLIKDLRVEGNTITGAHSQFKTRYPNNTYL
jgi:hypothetical protein